MRDDIRSIKLFSIRYFRRKRLTMTSARDIVTPHVDAMMEETKALQIPGDVLGRILFEQVLRIWRESRSLEDIREELTTAIEHLDPDEDFGFMRP
jgi:hypothetical protein